VEDDDDAARVEGWAIERYVLRTAAARSRVRSWSSSTAAASAALAARNAMIPAMRSAVVVMANADYSGGVLDTIQEAVLSKMMPAANAPKIAGASARDAALDMLRQIRSGTVDRSMLGAEYSAFLTPERLAAMAKSLTDAGEISQVETGSIGERGGLEVSTLRMMAGTTPIST
jgi:hypothetical protein